MEQTPSWTERTGTTRKAIEAKLSALQNANQLAIHMAEEDEHATAEEAGHAFIALPKILTDLNDVPACDIAVRIAQHRPSKFSLSLLPPTGSGTSMRPYMVKPGKINNYGYLFDLSPAHRHPARVLRAYNGGLYTDYDKDEKDIRLSHGSDISKLNTIYERFLTIGPGGFKEHLSNWESAVGGEQGLALTQQQLDALAVGIARTHRDRTVKNPFEGDTKDQTIADYNELVACVSTEHIAAIAVPSYRNDPVQMKLQAALVGLDHITNHHMQLPVVIYHVCAPHQGQCSYVGETREELVAVALASLQELGATGMGTLKQLTESDARYDLLAQALKEHLAVDITTPNWQQQAANQLAAAKVAPAR